MFLFCGRTCAYIFSTGLDILEQNGHGPGELRAMPHQVQRQPSACFLERSDDGEPYLIISGTGRQPISSRKCCDFCESEPCLALHELQQLRQLPSLSHPTPTAQVQSSTRPFVASGRGSGHLLRQEQAAAWTNDTRCRPCFCCSLVEWSWQISGCPITSEPVGMGCRSVRITPVMSPLHPRPRVLRWEWADPASGLVPGSMGPFGCGQKCLTKISQLVKLRLSQNWTQV